jgi:hypothetical protein
MKYCREQHMEISALKLQFSSVNICVLTIYKAPTGNVNYYTHKKDAILHTLYTAALDFIICGDININYLIDSERKNHLDTLLLSYIYQALLIFLLRVRRILSQQ